MKKLIKFYFILITVKIYVLNVLICQPLVLQQTLQVEVLDTTISDGENDIFGAKVVLKGVKFVQTKKLRDFTNNMGIAHFGSIMPGVYEVTVTAPEYKKQEIKNHEVEFNKGRFLTVYLQPKNPPPPPSPPPPSPLPVYALKIMVFDSLTADNVKEIIGAKITLKIVGDPEARERVAYTHENNPAYFDNLIEGAYNFKIIASGYEGVEILNHSIDTSQSREDLVVYLPPKVAPTTMRRLQFVDLKGKPVSNALVEVKQNGAFIDKGVTDSDGRYLLDSSPLDKSTLICIRAERKGFETGCWSNRLLSDLDSRGIEIFELDKKKFRPLESNALKWEAVTTGVLGLAATIFAANRTNAAKDPTYTKWNRARVQAENARIAGGLGFGTATISAALHFPIKKREKRNEKEACQCFFNLNNPK